MLHSFQSIYYMFKHFLFILSFIKIITFTSKIEHYTHAFSISFGILYKIITYFKVFEFLVDEIFTLKSSLNRMSFFRFTSSRTEIEECIIRSVFARLSVVTNFQWVLMDQWEETVFY